MKASSARTQERGAKNEAHFENDLHEQSIKGFLDAGILKHQTEKWDGPKSKVSQNCETIQQGLGPQKPKGRNGEDNEHGVVDPQKLKGNIPTNKTKSKKVKALTLRTIQIQVTWNWFMMN